MKRIIRGALCALTLCCILLFTACGTQREHTASFQSMDTLMTLKVYGGDDDICDHLQNRLETLDSLLDATDENSDIFRLNNDGRAEVSGDTAALLSRSLALCEKLDGAFDITVYPAVTAWGFVSGDHRVPDENEQKALADMIDYHSVSADGNLYALPEGVKLDLGAVAKGYAADECDAVLSDCHATAAVLNLGGTIKLYGQKPDGSRFTVGIADPDNPTGYFGTLICDQGVVATSGGYERCFEKDGKRYIHILDPATAAPVENAILSVTVYCDNGAEADALSTALFVMGLDRATEYYRNNGGFDFIILTDDDQLYLTEGIFDDFTLNEGYDFTVNKIEL